jgi:hypothetical protein
MLSAERPCTMSRRIALAIALLALLIAGAAGAAREGPTRGGKRDKVGGLTAVMDQTILVNGKLVNSPVGTPKTTKEFKALYAGDRVRTTVSGQAWFNVRVKKKKAEKSLFCTLSPAGPDAGQVTVTPTSKVMLQIKSGTLECATSATGGQKTIMVQKVTMKTVDPVFNVIEIKRKVVIHLRRGAATIIGRHPGKAVVVGLNTNESKRKAKVVVVAAGGDPAAPTTVAALPDKTAVALQQKVAPPSTDITPPNTTLRGRPANPSAQTEVHFVFSSQAGALFSCSLNGQTFHACTSREPQLVKPGLNAFAVKATDTAGNTGPPQTYMWFVERNPNAPLVFQSDKTGLYELYRIKPDGTDQKQLTNTGGNFDPAWSPDGTEIAFESIRDRHNGTEIYVMNADGSQIVRLTNNSTIDRTPKWSPDGKSIVFASNRTGAYQVYTMAADGTGVAQLTSGSENSDPAWSPDGKKIAFETSRDGDPEIYVMNADGSQETRVTKNTFGDFNPIWSPNGKQILFESDRDGNEEVYVMNADGSNSIRLTRNPARDSNPVWSPDARRIAFSSNRDGDVNIYIANVENAEGAPPKRLTSGHKNDLSPSW